ncbi:MAG TPA: deoxyribonuclease IV [Bacteroidetes bacterium]|nr:deoxyribonuclease IV [Bacteroidota bacterium]
MILGAHVSTAGGVENAPGNAARFGIRALALFTRNQRQWKAKPLSPDSIARFREERDRHGITHCVSHDSYLINLCAPDPEKLTLSIDALTDEVERAEQLGLSHVVAHPGSHLKRGEEWGIETIAHSLSEVHRRLPGCGAKIALEITAGQGTNLGYRFEQIARMIELSEENERLAVCFDTCHAYSAGYDLLSAEGYEKTWEEFDRLIGLERLQVIHLNDTRKPLGSRVDRHDQIGDGLLGLEPFRRMVNDPRFTGLPGILETPQGEGGYAEDLRRLRSLIEGSPSR